MADSARRIVRAVGVPVIADADTGYGNPVNVVRTVQMYEDAGVAAIHIEDQVSPKKCGHMTGKQVLPADEMTAKIRAAVAARQSPDFMIIARTDARAVEGLDRALARARLYRQAGADAIFVEAPESQAEIEKIAHTLQGIPLLFNWVEGGRTPPVALGLLRELGFRIVIFPIGALLGAAHAIRDLLTVIKNEGTPASAMARMTRFDDFLDFIGLPEIREIEGRFG
jgi:2-methylisocitrate lyase-like PEP mutase family enzyme